MAEHRFQLERFYFGLFGDTPQAAKPTVLARSAGVTTEQINDCLLVARVEPPPPDQTADEMKSTIGLFRGEKTDYILAIAQANRHKRPQILYILLPAELLRQLAGNWTPFVGFGESEMAIFDSLRTDLPPLQFDNPQSDSHEDQSEAMSDLLLNCQDNFNTVEGILTALIAGANIAIINAPHSLNTRLHFLEGLNVLLPPPARVGLTFATSVLKPENSLAQIKFVFGKVSPEKHVLYNWETGKLIPSTFEKHDYARFIISQLRLDPAKVIEQTEALARTAVWRAIRKDNLADALYWVSRRARVDSAVKANQPADRALVASVLRQDPTLPDDLRIAYARHLLSLTLPLREWETADAIPPLAGAHADLAQAVFEHLRDAAQAEHALDVFDLLTHWIKNVHGSNTLPWSRVLHLAALTYLDQLLKKDDLVAVAEFIERLSNPDPAFQFESIASQIAERLWQVAPKSPPLAMALVLLVSDHLPPANFQSLIGHEALLPQLPLALQGAFRAFKVPNAPAGVLARGAASVPETHQNIVLIRLVESAVQLEKYALIDENVLGRIIPMMSDPRMGRFQMVFQYLIEDFQRPERIRGLGNTGVTLLPQLYFANGRIEDGVNLLENYQNEVFTVKRLDEFTEQIGKLFLKTHLLAPALMSALEAIADSRLRPEPRVRALCAGFIHLEWDAKLKPIVDRLSEIIFADFALVNTIRLENAMLILAFYEKQRDSVNALKVASAVVKVVADMGKSGPPVMVEMVKHLQWNAEIKAAGIEILRRYIRSMTPDKTKLYPMYFRKQLDDTVGDALEATRLLRTILGDEDLIKFAEEVRIAADLFTDIAVTYHPTKENPSVIRLKQSLDGMSGGLDENERQKLASNVSQIAYLIYTLGSETEVDKDGKLRKQTMASTASRSRKGLESLPDETPLTAINFLRWMGVFFRKQLIMDMNLTREAPAHVLGARSATVFYHESDTIVALLQRLQEAFVDKQAINFSTAVLKTEMESLWGQLNLYTQRQIDDILGEKTQELSILLRIMANHATPRSLTDTAYTRQLETGRNQPKCEIEALRWISGYFARKHRA